MKNPKRRMIYSNFYDEWCTEEDARMYLFETSAEEEGWETEEDIPDDRVWDQICIQEEFGWDDEKVELKRFFDGGEWILQGSLGLWNRRARGGFIFSSFDELSRAWDDCDYIRLYDENGHFFIDAAHHDGTNCYEAKRLTGKGKEYVENHMYDSDEEVHDVVFNSNFFSALPHYAHKVYGCKMREAA